MLLEGRRDEQSKYQAQQIESKVEPTVGETNKLEQGNKCRNCGREYPHSSACPAKRKTCNKCGKQNHFAAVCRWQPAQTRYRRNQRQNANKTRQPRSLKTIDTKAESKSDASSEEDYLYSMTDNRKNNNRVNVTVGGAKFKITVDTGASINVIDRETYNKIQGMKLSRTNTKAFAYNTNSPVEFLGKFEAVIETRKRMTVATFCVAKGESCGILLSLNTAQELGLVSIHVDKLTTKDRALETLLQKNNEVFPGLGKLKKKIPKAQPQRRIPYYIREKVKTALTELENQEIIEKVPENEATPWVSPIVAVPKKDGQVRICVDMRMANEAIRRVRHPIPTVNGVSFALNGAKFFSKLDLSQAYHQIELDEQSRYITTFSTHVGLYRYKRLNYGTNAAAEIFQYTLETALQGLKGVKNIADDIIIFGSTRAEHDSNLDKCLQRLKAKGLRLNKSKCSFLNNTLTFFGSFSDRLSTR